MVQIYWQVNNSANLKKFNWESLQVIDAKNINITPFEWYKNKLQDTATDNSSFTIFIFDFDTIEQTEYIIKEIPQLFEKEYLVIILTPISRIVEIQKKCLKIKNFYIFQKPIRSLEFYLQLKSLCLLYIQSNKIDVALEKKNYEQIEQLIPFINYNHEELIAQEEKVKAFENLLDYTTKLLKEEETMTSALLTLNEYRDEEEVQSQRNIDARENLTAQLMKELKQKSMIIEGLENLLEYSRLSKIACEDLLSSYKHNETLTIQEIKDLLQHKSSTLEKLKKN